MATQPNKTLGQFVIGGVTGSGMSTTQKSIIHIADAETTSSQAKFLREAAFRMKRQRREKRRQDWTDMEGNVKMDELAKKILMAVVDKAAHSNEAKVSLASAELINLVGAVANNRERVSEALARLHGASLIKVDVTTGSPWSVRLVSAPDRA